LQYAYGRLSVLLLIWEMGLLNINSHSRKVWNTSLEI
jgi:hypothetical protein